MIAETWACGCKHVVAELDSGLDGSLVSVGSTINLSLSPLECMFGRVLWRNLGFLVTSKLKTEKLLSDSVPLNLMAEL